MYITSQVVLNRSSRRSHFWCKSFAFVLTLLSFNVSAGNISYNLSLTDSRLTLTQQGDSSAFYPQVLRMLPDGQWQALALAPGATVPAEMMTGDHVDFVWPEARPLQSLPPFERIQPMMVRFFDQAGVSLGQISFFNQPPPATETLPVNYAVGKLEITPPAEADRTIVSTWVLWPQEDGIAPIRKAINFDSPRLDQQPPAQHIQWKAGMEKLLVNTGAGQPAAMLLHETTHGYTLQPLPSGGVQGKQQRAAWLGAGEWFYRVAKLTLTAAVLLSLFHAVRARRKGLGV